MKRLGPTPTFATRVKSLARVLAAEATICHATSVVSSKHAPFWWQRMYVTGMLTCSWFGIGRR